MIHKIVKYKVNREALAVVESAILDFVEAIKASEPNTVYTVYRTEDETIFYHTMTFPSPAEESIHQEAAYTKEFVKILYPNCEIVPQFEDLIIFKTTSPSEVT
jgi:quinol monooxygenase YgiN